MLTNEHGRIQFKKWGTNHGEREERGAKECWVCAGGVPSPPSIGVGILFFFVWMFKHKLACFGAF